MKTHPFEADRIARIRRRYTGDIPHISVERARYYTEGWRELDPGLPAGIRVAESMKNVYKNMSFHIDPDDRIAGTWTECYLGVPIDIERGLFNGVLETELDLFSMIGYHLRTQSRFLRYMIRKNGFRSFYQNLKQSRQAGVAMPGIGLETIEKRKVNAYQIRPQDKKLLQRELLPYWKGNTVADLIQEGLNGADLHRGDMAGFSAASPPATSRNDTIVTIGAAIGTWQGHLILDHERVIKYGLRAILSEFEEAIGRFRDQQNSEVDFLHSVRIALEGIIIFAQRLADSLSAEINREADPEKRQILEAMAESCQQVPLNPARNFAEAVQSYWTHKTAVELAVPFNVHAPGRLDQILNSFYTEDLQKGIITPGTAKELLKELFLKIMSHNMRPYSNFNGYFAQRYEGSEPVTMGGLTEKGSDATNELTYLMLEAAAESKAALNFVIRVHGNTPDSLLMKVAELQYQGNSCFSLMNDDVSIRALKKRGVSHKDALDYAITGCVDMCPPGKTGGESFSAFLMSRVLDITLRNGDSNALISIVENTGLKTGDPDSFKTFDQFLDAYYAQAKLQMDNIVKAAGIRDRVYAEHLPSPHISAFIQGCLENGKDVTRGGAKYDFEGILFMNSIANLVDSLLVIKKLIFEQKRFTFKELLAAIDNNFEGYEGLHRSILAVEGKWGNGDPECDALARKVTTRLFEGTYQYRTFRDGRVAPFINSMTSHTYDGRICIATPDGRKAAKPFAASCNPYNVDKNGITGVMRSVAALDYSHVLGCAVNVRMHPSGIGDSRDKQQKWIALIKTYFDLGGEQIQPTVTSTEVLKDAQKNPENYRDVIVKVGGYSAYFVELGFETQNEIIARSEHR